MGHATACFLAGITVEYVTIWPETERVFPRLGFCHYDHAIKDHIRADPHFWRIRLAIADSGGPVAERLYLGRSGLPLEPENPIAWPVDEENARGHLDALGVDSASQPELVETVRRMLEAEFETYWSGISAAAELLMLRWAVPGVDVRACFGEVRLFDLSPFLPA
jgi:hypothetical protein